jgi:glycosyltransferase involved in cell wall biosynthesis
MTAAIVPARDEERTVGEVVRALKRARGIDEVIVVDDGSTDGTAAAAESAGARVVRLPENLGKGQALRAGVAATRAGILFFCDADFLGLAPAHVERLLEPVRSGRLAMCAGLRDRGPLTPIIAHLPLISGERALRREVFEGVPERFLRGFRVEIALNWYCRANRLPYGSIPTVGVGFVSKLRKVGPIRALPQYLAMVWQVAEAMIRVRCAREEFRVRASDSH